MLDSPGRLAMWRTDTLWFDVAVVMTIFAVGSILFGRFEEHKPRARRVIKVAIVLAVTVLLSATAGRLWAYQSARGAAPRRRLGAPLLAAKTRNQRLDRRAPREIFRTRSQSASTPVDASPLSGSGRIARLGDTCLATSR